MMHGAATALGSQAKVDWASSVQPTQRLLGCLLLSRPQHPGGLCTACVGLFSMGSRDPHRILLLIVGQVVLQQRQSQRQQRGSAKEGGLEGTELPQGCRAGGVRGQAPAGCWKQRSRAGRAGHERASKPASTLSSAAVVGDLAPSSSSPCCRRRWAGDAWQAVTACNAGEEQGAVEAGDWCAVRVGEAASMGWVLSLARASLSKHAHSTVAAWL